MDDKRSLHEERDRIEMAIVNEIISKKTSHREKLDSEHRQKALLDRYMKCSKHLVELYELPQMVHIIEDPPTAFNDFYLALKEIKEFYNRHSNDQVVTMASEFEEIEAARQIALGLRSRPIQQMSSLDEENDDDEHADDGKLDKDGELLRLTKGLPTTDLVDVIEPTANLASTNSVRAEKLVDFTDEEGYGRYLDLTKCHEAYLQVIKNTDIKANYLTFLDKFDRFADLHRELKLNSAYKTYVEMLLEYFRDYSRRAKPLFDYQDMETKAHENFLGQWNNKTFQGWFRDADRQRSDDADQAMIDLDTYRSCDELMQLGLDCLKHELQVRGLKCGGSLEERANRLWSVKGKRPEEIDSSLRANSIVMKGKKKKCKIDPFYIASIEAKLSMYVEYFSDHRLATIENVQRKQARTAEERNESDEDISDIEEDDSNQNDIIYNPKNLPLGWDGKPIPYWLYKLHGLNLTFTCEICGNATYKGPKTFQRHFVEWRHAQGMRSLGIPNSAHFANITKILDAMSLWEKLKQEKQKDKFNQLNEEEYEDSQGNVVNKKTYEDLKRQGLL